MRSRVRLISTPKDRDNIVAKRWIRPMQPVLQPNPQDREVAAEVEFTFDGEALHVAGCQPLRA